MASANKKAKAGIIATRKLLKGERMAGFKATTSALDAIYGNLSTTQAGIGRNQTVANQKTMAALARLAGKTDRATGRLVRGGEAAMRNQYGSVVGAAVDRSSGTLEAAASAANATLKGEVGAGRAGVKGAASVLGIVKAGAAEARAGASGQLADALQYRARQDAQIIAGMQQSRMDAQFAAQQARRDAELQFQNWKKQQDYLAKLEDKDTSAQLGGVKQAADTAGDAAVFFREYMQQNPGSTTPALVEAYHAKYGSLGGSEDPLLNILASNVVKSTDTDGNTVASYGRTDETRDIVQALHTLYPSFGKARSAVQNLIGSRWDAWDAEQAVKVADDAARAADDPDIDATRTPVVDPSRAAAAVKAAGGDPAQVTAYQVTSGDAAGQTRYQDESGYTVTKPKVVTEGVAATDTSLGTTRSGRTYRLYNGVPYYMDTGYIVISDDLPQ